MPRLRNGSSASRRIRDRFWGVPLSLALGLTSGSAFANGLPRVALVTADPTTTTSTRLAAELRGLGVEVVVVPVDETQPLGRAALEQLARTDGAFAAVRVIRVAAEVEVWIADRVTGKTVVREVRAGAGDAGSRDDTIAVGTVELLRASLLEVTVEPQTLHGEVTPPSRSDPAGGGTPPPAQATGRDSGVAPVRPRTGSNLDTGIGGLGPSLALGLAVRWQSEGAWGLQTLAATPLRSATVESRGRDRPTFASIAPALGATLSAATEEPLVPLVALGFALVRMEAPQAHPSAGYEAPDRGCVGAVPLPQRRAGNPARAAAAAPQRHRVAPDTEPHSRAVRQRFGTAADDLGLGTASPRHVAGARGSDPASARVRFLTCR